MRNQEDKTIRFKDYVEFIYLNSHLSMEEAEKVARQYWNDDIPKREMLTDYIEHEKEREKTKITAQE